MLVPLWASYLVKAFSWRAIIGSPGGVLDKTFGMSPNYGETALVIVLAYLWLPFMIVPIYAGLERLPDSLLDASSDLGAHFGFTFRKVVLPILFPSIVAGSIFTFSLSLGDYIAVDLVGGKTQMIGSVVFDNFSADLPFAAAFAVVPVIIMVVFLLGVRRTRRVGEPLMHFTRRVRLLLRRHDRARARVPVPAAGDHRDPVVQHGRARCRGRRRASRCTGGGWRCTAPAHATR